MSALENAARSLWFAWGEYAKNTTCTRCQAFTYCRQRSRRGPWLCLDCFDVSPEAERSLR